MLRVGIPTLLFYMEDIKNKIRTLAESLTGYYGVAIVDIDLAGSMRKPLVRVFIDKENGVSLDDCANFSRSLSALFDVEDPIPSAYVLEVSSPGLDRPLKNIRDFQISLGKLARVVTKNSIEGQNVFIGRIYDVKGSQITLVVQPDQRIEIQFDQISKARLEIELK